MNPIPEIDELNAFFKKAFKVAGADAPYVTEFKDGRAVIRLDVAPFMLRPGGFISGPTQMGLADHAAYVAIFSKIGITPMALTSNLNINFLRPCTGDFLTAEADIVKIGQSLAVINVNIRGGSSPKISSQSVVTYALPKN